MGAYNLIRGQHCCESELLLKKILRGEWGYDGTVISDWGGAHHTVPAGKSALDIDMSVTPDFDEYVMANPLLEAVRNGEVDEADIDEKIRHILLLMLRIRLNPRAFQMYDVNQAAWVKVPGTYEVLAGSSSADIRQSVKITVS